MKNEKVVFVVAQGLLCTRLRAVSLLSSNLVRGVHVCGHFSLSPVSKRETARNLVMYMYNDEFPSEICNPL